MTLRLFWRFIVTVWFKTKQLLLTKIFQIWLLHVTLFTLNTGFISKKRAVKLWVFYCHKKRTKVLQGYIQYIILLEILHLIVILLNFSCKRRMSVSRKGTFPGPVSTSLFLVQYDMVFKFDQKIHDLHLLVISNISKEQRKKDVLLLPLNYNVLYVTPHLYWQHHPTIIITTSITSSTTTIITNAIKMKSTYSCM